MEVTITLPAVDKKPPLQQIPLGFIRAQKAKFIKGAYSALPLSPCYHSHLLDTSRQAIMCL